MEVKPGTVPESDNLHEPGTYRSFFFQHKLFKTINILINIVNIIVVITSVCFIIRNTATLILIPYYYYYYYFLPLAFRRLNRQIPPEQICTCSLLFIMPLCKNTHL